MSSTPITVIPRVVVNARDIGVVQTRYDIFELPGSTAGQYADVKLVEVPSDADGVPFTIYECTEAGATSGAAYGGMTGNPNPRYYKTTGQIWNMGVVTIGLGAINYNTFIRVDYAGIGSVISAEDINELADGTGIHDGAIVGRHFGAITLPMSAPSPLVKGAMWYDTASDQYMGYNGVDIIVLG